MSSEAQNPEQPTPEQVEDLTLDKETLKDLEPRSEEQDNVRGGGTIIYTAVCYAGGGPQGGPTMAPTTCQPFPFTSRCG